MKEGAKEPQVKSKQRVADHGEVFTAQSEVNAMCDLVSDAFLNESANFLEPACGDGNFLAEILRRKLAKVTRKYKRSAADYEKHSLIALGSLYGVELLMDNVEACRERLLKIWDDFYTKAVKKKERREGTEDSARYILEKNIICGNALTLHKVDENGQDTQDPIIFSEWTNPNALLLKRKDYSFDNLLKQQEHPEAPKDRLKEVEAEEALDFVGTPAPPPKEPEQAAMDLSSLSPKTSSEDGEGKFERDFGLMEYYQLRNFEAQELDVQNTDSSEH